MNKGEFRVYNLEETFKGLQGKEIDLSDKDFEDCHFENSSFNDLALKNCRFTNCTFQDCDLSNSNLLNSSFQDCTFNSCKLMGLHFNRCNEIGFSVRFNTCNLDYSTFFQMRLDRCEFISNSMKGVDLEGAICSKISMRNCDLLDGRFDQTNLEGADLRGSFNFNIDLEMNFLKGCKISRESVDGLLNKYGINLMN